MTRVILDASALLAMLRGEPGGQAVREVLPQSMMSAVNLAEVVTKLIDKGGDAEEAARVARDLSCAISPPGRAAAIRAGLLHADLRKRGVSLADSFCLALAGQEQLPVLTADRAWADLGLEVEVQLIR